MWSDKSSFGGLEWSAEELAEFREEFRQDEAREKREEEQKSRRAHLTLVVNNT